MEDKIPQLPYPYDALEPYIDGQTMKIHHDKHHQAYLDKFNAALKGHPELQEKPAEELIRNLKDVPEQVRTAVRNHGGGYINHSFFWPLLKKGVKPEGEILEAINRSFGSFDSFREEFANAASTLFGSGWAWLVLDNGGLEIMQTRNQDSPLTEGKVPLLAIDVWEHAYYLKYRNRRADYIGAFFNVINWEKVNEHFLSAMKR
jgi:Fe-Mn family superoxide dismutase